MISRLIVAILRWRNVRRHRRCLANIVRLERAMGMEITVRPPVYGYPEDMDVFAPGAVWAVDGPTAAAVMYKHAVFGTGAYARIVYGSNFSQIMPAFHQPTEGRS